MEPSALSLSLSLNLSFYERALLDSLAEITTTTTTTTTSVNQLEWVWLPHPLESLCLLLLLLRALVVDSYRPPEPSCILLCQLMRFLDETWHHLPFRPDNCHPWTGSRDHVRKDGFPTSVVLGRVIFGFGRVNFFFFWRVQGRSLTSFLFLLITGSFGLISKELHSHRGDFSKWISLAREARHSRAKDRNLITCACNYNR